MDICCVGCSSITPMTRIYSGQGLLEIDISSHRKNMENHRESREYRVTIGTITSNKYMNLYHHCPMLLIRLKTENRNTIAAAYKLNPSCQFSRYPTR